MVVIDLNDGLAMYIACYCMVLEKVNGRRDLAR